MFPHFVCKGSDKFKNEYILFQGLIQAVFEISIPILGTLIWACPNSIKGRVKATKKCKTCSNLLGHIIDIS